MKLIQYKCDSCHAIITDDDKVIKVTPTIYVSMGERDAVVESSHERHFCCSHCVHDFLDTLLKDVEPKKKKK